MKIFFILNPTSRDHVWDWREAAARAAHRHGHQARFGEVDRRRPQSTERLLQQAEEEECDRIGIIGGDGSINRVINVLAKTGRLAQIPLALVPGGTCNDFVKIWGWTARSQEAALRAACSGSPRPFDLGLLQRDDGSNTFFLNNAGFGRRTPLDAGQKSSRWETLRNLEPVNLKIATETANWEGPYYVGLVCNGPYFSGGLHFSSTAKPNDGLLNSYFVGGIPRWKLGLKLVRARFGHSMMGKEVLSIASPSIAIQSSSDLWPQADGEPAVPRPCRRIVLSVAPEKVLIVSPF
jgi:diacylglycerol kinase (ATP)